MIPEKLNIPWIKATSITNTLSQVPPNIHIRNHTRFEPKCAYFNEKYKLLHITIIIDTNNMTDDAKTEIINYFSKSQPVCAFYAVNVPITLTNINTTWYVKNT